MRSLIICLFISTIIGSSCKKSTAITRSYRIVREVKYNNISVDVVIDKPENDTVDVLVVYHGTVTFDNKIIEAANNTLDGFKRILARKDMMLVSVAYPEENLLIGDNLSFAEAGLLWVKNKASQELGITIRKVFLAGHSQGGYLTTRLNTMHSSNGVIANAPGPLNLAYRCQLEVSGQVPPSIACGNLQRTYGSPLTIEAPYLQRSLINHTSHFKADILFTQGLDDSPIQLYSWPTFKQKVNDCTDCKERLMMEFPGFGHNSLFESPSAQSAFNEFIGKR